MVLSNLIDHDTDLDLWKDPGPYLVEQSWGIIGGAVDFF